MRRGIIAVIFFVMTFFAAANDRNYLDYEETAGGVYYIHKLNKNMNGIFLGSILLGCSPAAVSLPVGLLLSKYRFGLIDDWGGIFGDGLFITGNILLCVGSLGMLINGIIFTSINSYNYYYRVKELEMPKLTEWLEKKSKNFLRIAIPNIAISSASLLMTMAGIFMTAFGYVKELRTSVEYDCYNANIPAGKFIVSKHYLVDGLYVGGIVLDILGAVGLGICLPLMIASLAMSAWCKGQAAKFTPDIAIIHDDKKGYTDGYGVSIGMRVRI